MLTDTYDHRPVYGRHLGQLEATRLRSRIDAALGKPRAAWRAPNHVASLYRRLCDLLCACQTCRVTLTRSLTERSRAALKAGLRKLLIATRLARIAWLQAGGVLAY